MAPRNREPTWRLYGNELPRRVFFKKWLQTLFKQLNRAIGTFAREPPTLHIPSLRRVILSKMARLGRRGFLVIAVVFHLIYIYSVFDIYFVSPIVSGMREFSVASTEPPAQRLVLFVGTVSHSLEYREP